jgi:hypothetical protein
MKKLLPPLKGQRRLPFCALLKSRADGQKKKPAQSASALEAGRERKPRGRPPTEGSTAELMRAYDRGDMQAVYRFLHVDYAGLLHTARTPRRVRVA